MAIASTLTILPETQSKLPMDLNRDFVPIGLLDVLPMGCIARHGGSASPIDW
jgi:hypothetical protein